MFNKLSTTLAGIAIATSSAIAQTGFQTAESSYLNPTPGSDFTFQPIVTVGDLVPRTSGGPSDKYAFVGIPDAMGIYRDRVTGENVLFVAHETNSSTVTTPIPGATGFKGAFVSRFVLEADGSVRDASIAHGDLFLENTFQANTSPRAGDANAFTRFCSGAFAGPQHGMDRPLFFTNEESGSGNYDANGSQTVVVADGKMYTVPALGRVARETTTVQPRRDSKTVVISSEDAGSPSYMYMYVGTKLRRSSSVLDKNGLTNGKIYVLAGRDAQHNEGTFFTGSLPVKWVEVVNGASLTAAQLITAADAVGAFGFVRIEDIEFDPTQPTRSFFMATTGGSGPNTLGRLYEVTMNPLEPTAEGTMNVVYNADTIVRPGGTFTGTVGTLEAANGATGTLGSYSTPGAVGTGTDYCVSIDNIAVSGDWIICQEDRNSPADAVFAFYGRNGGVWSLDRNNGNAAKLQSTFNYAYVQARDGHSAPTAGRWESSGVIDSSAIFGPGTFVINVQGHIQGSPVNTGRTNAPNPAGGTFTRAEFLSAYAEDGQLLIMRPAAP